jgi:hypothetical protein
MYLFELEEPIWEIEHDAPCLVTGMMARANPIDVPPSCSASNSVSVILRARREGKVHEMGDGSLAPTAIGISHDTLLVVRNSLQLQVGIPYRFRHFILVPKSRLRRVLVLLLAILIVPGRRVDGTGLMARTSRTRIETGRSNLGLVLLERRMGRGDVEGFPTRCRRVRGSRSHCRELPLIRATLDRKLPESELELVYKRV